jgi:hypothetical protein
VLAPILGEQLALLCRSERIAAARERADAPPERPVGGLAREHDLAAARAQRRREPRPLGGLPGAVEALERDESPTVHGAPVARRSRARARAGARNGQPPGIPAARSTVRAWHGACSTQTRAIAHARQHPSNGTGGRRVLGRRAGALACRGIQTG